MGLFDDVTCECPLPDGRDVVGRAFQTRSLGGGMDRFTITAAGRLIFHQHQYPPACDGAVRFGPAVRLADIDLNYHGDLELYGIDTAGHAAHYTVRFTNGAVEWIQPFNDLSAHREWLQRASG